MEEINLSNLDSVMDFSFSGNNNNKSSSLTSSFGPGIELLMNDRKSSSNNINIDLGELDSLEKELNEMTGNQNNGGSGGSNGGNGGGGDDTTRNFAFSDFTNMFGMSGDTGKDNGVSGGMFDTEDSNIGNATRNTSGSAQKTWDGFAKFNEVPVDYKTVGGGGGGGGESSSAKLNEREKRRKKKLMLKKLEEWHEKGLLKNYTHLNNDSPFDEIEDEYESALEDKRKKDSVKLQGWWFMTFVNSVEYANAAFNPFDINLDGWGEQVSEDIDSYEEIFNELHEKYKGGKLSPELSLLLRLGFSAAVVNFTNKALSTATPGFNDVIKQNPELMKMFTNATVSSMSQQSPGFAFASNLVNSPDQINTSFGPPPPPIETKVQSQHQHHSQHQSQQSQKYNPAPPTTLPQNRQDIQMARGSMFRESGVDLAQNAADFNTAPPPPQQQQQQHTQIPRQEMRGPQDIDNILSGLKPKQIQTSSNMPHINKMFGGNLGTPQQQATKTNSQYSSPLLEEIVDLSLSSGGGGTSSEMFSFSSQQQMHKSEDNDNSMISISSLKNLQQDITIPTKKGRRPRNSSNKNVIQLDI